jgi:ABC-type multidrug transport system fused ATPase/permease subunit
MRVLDMKEKLKAFFAKVASYSRLFGYAFKKKCGLTILSVLISLTGAALLPAGALLISYIASLITNGGDGLMIIIAAVGVAVIKTMSSVLNVLQRYICESISLSIELPLKLEFQELLTTFDLRWKESQEFAQMSAHAVRAIDSTSLVQTINLFPNTVAYVLSLISVFIILCSVNWVLPVAALVMYILKMRIAAKTTRYYNRAMNAAGDVRLASTIMEDDFSDKNINMELRIYSKLDWAIEKWKATYQIARRKYLEVQDKYALFLSLDAAASTLFTVVMIALYLLLTKKPGTDSIVLVINAFTGFETAAGAVASAFGLASGKFFEIDNYMKLMKQGKQQKHFDTCNTGTAESVQLIASGLSFSYDGENDVLSDIDLSVKAGEKVALVGENGSGKTTLAKLILQLYHPGKGTVRLTDQNGAAVSPKMSAVLQDYVRYELSVRDNIGLSDIEKMDDDEAICAAYQAVCGDALPLTPDEILGKQFGDRDLSGGEWQRLAIARAYFREAPLIVLDEPNASIDAFAEAAMIKRMFEMAKDKTCIFITHRLTTTALADRIIVMKDGRICEEGTHEELMRRNGEYARMYSVQAEMYA